MTREELFAHADGRYSIDPEFPWEGLDAFVLRHRENRKWFAVGMRVAYRRLGIEKDGSADVLDVKVGPLLMDAYRKLPGVLPGYHMNKDNWITLLLDGSAEDALIRETLELSYDLTRSRR